jgi:hypothetical protein
MFILSWVFDKLGYMPKVSVDTTWSFPVAQHDKKPQPNQVVKKTTKVAKKTTSVKIPKATTRTSTTKK